MIGKNSDLKAVCESIDREIFRLRALKSAQGLCVEFGPIDLQLTALARQRRALCLAVVNREIEASRRVVSLSQWLSGNGALDELRIPRPGCVGAAPQFAEHGR